MKTLAMILAVLGPAMLALADEPVNATCHVQDENGVVLPTNGEARARNFEGMRGVSGMSERFFYDVYLQGGAGRFVLLDKPSGEKVVVEHSQFTVGETITVSLFTRDTDVPRLTLRCVGD